MTVTIRGMDEGIHETMQLFNTFADHHARLLTPGEQTVWFAIISKSWGNYVINTGPQDLSTLTGLSARYAGTVLSSLIDKGYISKIKFGTFRIKEDLSGSDGAECLESSCRKYSMLRAFLDLVNERELSAAAVAVWAQLLRLDCDGFGDLDHQPSDSGAAITSPQELAERIGRSSNYASKLIQSLKDAGAIEQLPRQPEYRDGVQPLSILPLGYYRYRLARDYQPHVYALCRMCGLETSVGTMKRYEHDRKCMECLV